MEKEFTGVFMPFKAFGLNPSLLRAIQELEFKEPTPIQVESIPAILTGRDVLATAQTGSGKTAAYLLPTIHHLLSQEKGVSQLLILVPQDNRLHLLM